MKSKFLTPETKFEQSVSLLTWAYNEEDSIVEFLERATEMLDNNVEDYEILLIDDGSKDRTFELADSFRKTRNPRVRILRNEVNRNVGFCHKKAVKAASKDYLLWQMVDWCYDLTDFRHHLNLLKQFDVVQGVRRKPVKVRLGIFKPFAFVWQAFGIRHVTKRSDTVWKAFVSLINYSLIRLIFRIPLGDFQNVTYYPTRWIQNLEYESESSFVNPESLIKAHWAGLSIIEVPINFNAREKGEAKGSSFKMLRNGLRDVVRFGFKWMILRRRPFAVKGEIDRRLAHV